MFREYIQAPIEPIPLDYVNRLARLENEPDYSLTSLGVALLKPRMPNYNGIAGVYSVHNTRRACIENFNQYLSNNTGTESPIYCYYKYSTVEDDQDLIKENFKDFTEKTKIEAYIKQQTERDCLVMVHNTKNIAVVFTNSLDFRIYHLFLVFISMYFPAIFAENPLEAELKKKLITVCSSKDKNAFYTFVHELLKPYEVELKRIGLVSLIKDLHEINVNAARKQVDEQRLRVNQFERNFAAEVAKLRSLSITFEGLKAVDKFDEDGNELVEYLTKNNNIRNLTAEGHRLKFSVATRLNMFNEDAWEDFSKSGHIFDGNYKHTITVEEFRTRENRKILLNSIFSRDAVFKIKMAGNYMLNLDECRVTTESGYNYDADPFYKTYLPNPHIKIHGCLGDFRPKIVSSLLERDYITAFELCIASAGSINLDEVDQTFRPFISYILNSNEKCLVMKDGTEVTPVEALEYLKKGENNK